MLNTLLVTNDLEVIQDAPLESLADPDVLHRRSLRDEKPTAGLTPYHLTDARIVMPGFEFRTASDPQK